MEYDRKVLRIVIIDDEEWNQVSARFTLQNHDLTVISTLAEAYALIKSKPPLLPDFLLTDLYMPVGSSDVMGAEASLTQEGEVPAGLVFGMWAVSQGIRTAICSDEDCNHPALISLLDVVSQFNGQVHPINNHIRFYEAGDVAIGYPSSSTTTNDLREWGERNNCPLTTDPQRYVKDWSAVLEPLLIDAGVQN